MHAKSICPTFNQAADYEQKLQELVDQSTAWEKTPGISFNIIKQLFESNKKWITAQNIDKLESANKRLKKEYTFPAAQRLFNETTQFIRTKRKETGSQAPTPAKPSDPSSSTNGKHLTPSQQSPQSSLQSVVPTTLNAVATPSTSSSQPQQAVATPSTSSSQPQQNGHQSSASIVKHSQVAQATLTVPSSLSITSTSTSHTSVISKSFDSTEFFNYLISFFSQEDKTWPNFKEFQEHCRQLGLSFDDVAKFIYDLPDDEPDWYSKSYKWKLLMAMDPQASTGDTAAIKNLKELQETIDYVLKNERTIKSEADKQNVLSHMKLSCILVGHIYVPDSKVEDLFNREIRKRRYIYYYFDILSIVEMKNLAKLYRKYMGLPETQPATSGSRVSQTDLDVERTTKNFQQMDLNEKKPESAPAASRSKVPDPELVVYESKKVPDTELVVHVRLGRSAYEIKKGWPRSLSARIYSAQATETYWAFLRGDQL
jgi:hypothetical protein